MSSEPCMLCGEDNHITANCPYAVPKECAMGHTYIGPSEGSLCSHCYEAELDDDEEMEQEYWERQAELSVCGHCLGDHPVSVCPMLSPLEPFSLSYLGGNLVSDYTGEIVFMKDKDGVYNELDGWLGEAIGWFLEGLEERKDEIPF